MTKTMKKIPAFLLAGVIAAAFAFAIGTVTTQEAYAENYGLYVGGTQVTIDNKDDVLGDGTVRYDPGTSTLMLNNATITGVFNGRNILSSNQDFTINVTGKNSLSGGSIGIEAAFSITITGDGSLQAEGSDKGICSYETLTITDATVTATGGNEGISSQGELKIEGSSDVTATATHPGGRGIDSDGELKIEGSSKVHAVGGEYGVGALYASGITIGDGLLITEPENGRISDDRRCIVDKDNYPATSVTIEPIKYHLWIGSEQVTSINKGDILGDGKVKFEPASGNTPATLALDNATITDVQAGSKIHSGIRDLTINVKGKNSLSGGSMGIESAYSITITGDGSLQAEGSTIGISSHENLTITDATVTATGGNRGIYSQGELKIEGSSDVTATATYSNGDGIYSDGEVKIEGSSKVHAVAGEYGLCGLYAAKGITIGDGLLITEPENGRISAGIIIDKDNNTATSVTIEPVYAITLAKTTNGKASLSAEKAPEGGKIKVTATPDKDYILDKMTYTDKDGKTTAIPSSGEFTMPASDITVNVTFKKQNVKPEPTKPTTKPTTKPAPKPAPVAKVSGTLLAKMTAKGKKNLVLSWNKVNGAQGYDVFFVKCNHNNPCKLVETIKGNETFKWTKKKLKKRTAYKAYVKAWVMKDGKKSYVKTSPTVHAYTSGSTKNYTNAKKVTVKNSEVSLIKGNAYQIKAKVKKLKKGKKLMKKGHGPKLRYLSSNTKVATVSSSGKIRANAKGKCSVYVYAVNGAHKTIKVTVK